MPGGHPGDPPGDGLGRKGDKASTWTWASPWTSTSSTAPTRAGSTPASSASRPSATSCSAARPSSWPPRARSTVLRHRDQPASPASPRAACPACTASSTWTGRPAAPPSDLDDTGRTIDFDDLYLDARLVRQQVRRPACCGASATTSSPTSRSSTPSARPIPVLSDLAIMFGGAQLSLLDVLEGVSGNDLSLVRNVLDILDIVANMQDVDETVLIPLGPGDVPRVPVRLAEDPDAHGRRRHRSSCSPKQVKNGPCGGKMTASTRQRLGQRRQRRGGPGHHAGPRRAEPDPHHAQGLHAAPPRAGQGGYRSKTSVVTQTQPCRHHRLHRQGAGPHVTKWSQQAADHRHARSPSRSSTTPPRSSACSSARTPPWSGSTSAPCRPAPASASASARSWPGRSRSTSASASASPSAPTWRWATTPSASATRCSASRATSSPTAMLDGLYIDDYDAAGNETPEMSRCSPSSSRARCRSGSSGPACTAASR